MPHGIVSGATVTVRGARWRLDAAVRREDCHELHLSEYQRRRRTVVLWPFDRPTVVDGRRQFRAVDLRVWTRAIGHARDVLTPRATDGRPDIVPYQLAPAIAAARGASRIVLADEVGLGKTIQAGWILADLIAREPDAGVLVAVPAGLRRQWAGELSAFFGITAVNVDARWMRRSVADLPADVNPWAVPGVFLASLDYLKRPDVVASLERRVWDLLVVDEAHTATAPTDRHAALEAIAARSRRVVAITATPYSGDASRFASMAALGATSRDKPPIMFRRSREDVGDRRRRRHRFAGVRITLAESRLQRLLERYSRDVWQEAADDTAGARLAVTILRKRALSSAAAAARSLRHRLDLLRETVSVPRQLALFDEDEAGDNSDEVLPGALAVPGLADAEGEERWLETLIDAADRATEVDSKQLFLRRLLRRLRAAGGMRGRPDVPDGAWAPRRARDGESVIVFTEYRDTLLQLASGLPGALQLHGGLSAAERADLQARFNERGGLLLATDAAAEGLNLQQRCRTVINYELPWNPARLEQRIGRVDRIGQSRPVHAITLVARDTAEDLVIAGLARRLTRVAATLGERDRLATFLTEARTAGMVIGGAPAEPEADEEPGATACFSRPRADAEAVAAAAGRLAAARAVRGRDPHRHGPDGILVSRLRASARVSRGFVFLVRCAAVTGSGDVCADRAMTLHALAQPERPGTRAMARELAARAVETFLPYLDALMRPLAHEWLDEAQATHSAFIDRRISREMALRDGRLRSPAIQPGLFDRRAERRAEERSDTEHAVGEAHDRHIAERQEARALQLSCVLAGVLIVWR